MKNKLHPGQRGTGSTMQSICPGQIGQEGRKYIIVLLDRTLAKFNQLKRNKRFDNRIMLIWLRGSLFHITAGSHPVQKAWGHKIVSSGVKFKSCFNIVKNHTHRFLLL